MAERDFAGRIEAVRRFNRFYTLQLDLLQERRLYSPLSLAEARVLYELAHRREPKAADLVLALGLDPGYLSRILRGFTKAGLLERKRSPRDGREALLTLTAKGRAAFSRLNQQSLDQNGAVLKALPAFEQNRLVAAMATIEALLGPHEHRAVPYLMRTHGPGDMGWVVKAHGELYAREYGWDATFEALVAEIVARFVRRFDPRRERCWIAELDGEPVGSVFVVKKSATVAQLRLLIVDPRGRGLGIGKRLVDECIRFARQGGYRTLMLWTNSILLAARGIYRDAGFVMTGKERHHSFGHDLVGETWELKL